ncbi:acyl-CoA-binding domain-containing protein 5-like [Uloborus diversus]|uniref:acyl-CoA-binding domain-containing protein 5-like n=1 Tax=Uloborus diversus TaxID=327109 RepID=UPI00240A1614|nr:acyl-CoA-binding domain-containing protein 5-like [Uloborus diversus]
MTTRDKFMAAVEIINSLPRNGTFQPSEDLILKLYAFQKQAIDGPCKTSKPSIWDMSARNKWNAWNALGAMSKETAMDKYIDELKKVIETMSYNEKVSKFMSLIGPFYEVVTADEIDQGEKS